jgi:hypothetical protein
VVKQQEQNDFIIQAIEQCYNNLMKTIAVITMMGLALVACQQQQQQIQTEKDAPVKILPVKK